MKRKLILLMMMAGLVIEMTGQSNPVCNDLVVEKLQMANDSTMEVTIRNNCSNCSAAAYCNIMVIENSTDTICNTCFCLFSPYNSTLYYLSSKLPVIPPLSQLRVSMPCVCDNIPFDPTIGIDEGEKKESQIKIFPNPGNGLFYIQSLLSNVHVKVSVSNVLGEKIYQSGFFDQRAEIDLLGQPKGIYFVLVSTGNTNTTHKILIE